MEQLVLQTIDIIQKIGFVGLLIILALPKLRKIVFSNGDDKICNTITDLQGHAKIANEEMSEIKERLASIETKIEIIMKYMKI